jgi:hypothetical protein
MFRVDSKVHKGDLVGGRPEKQLDIRSHLSFVSADERQLHRKALGLQCGERTGEIEDSFVAIHPPDEENKNVARGTSEALPGFLPDPVVPNANEESRGPGPCGSPIPAR